MSQNEGNGQTNPLQVALTWLFVATPLAWGVLQTVNKSLALFR